MQLLRTIENILFASETPCTVKQLCTLSQATEQDVLDALRSLQDEFSSDREGLVILKHDGRYTLGTHPEASAVIGQLRKEESIGELSRAALETLSVITYRGPVTKPEIEQIRGVNCSVSLRNLLIAGLIEQKDASNGENTYCVSFDFLRHLGVEALDDLPQYKHLNTLLVAGKQEDSIASSEVNI